MNNTVIEEIEIEDRETILRDALDKVYEKTDGSEFNFASETIRDTHRELSRLFEARSSSIQREEVLHGALDTVYQDAVAEDCDEISDIVRKAYRNLSRLSDMKKVA